MNTEVYMHRQGSGSYKLKKEVGTKYNEIVKFSNMLPGCLGGAELFPWHGYLG